MALSTKKSNSASKIHPRGNVNFAEMFKFYARLVKLIILRKDDTDG